MHKLLYPLTVFLLAGSLFAADPFAGTWNLNLSKSKFGGPDSQFLVSYAHWRMTRWKAASNST